MTLFSCDDYHDDNYSDSNNYTLNYYEFDNNVSSFKQVDCYNFSHDSDTETTKEALDYNNFRYDNYKEFDDDYVITLMKRLDDK